MTPNLRHDGDTEYTMEVEKGNRAWISIGPFSVLLNRTSEGLVVDVWPKWAEDGESVLTMSLMDDEVAQTVDGPCPSCGRVEDGAWPVPCPSDDCPSHDEGRAHDPGCAMHTVSSAECTCSKVNL